VVLDLKINLVFAVRTTYICSLTRFHKSDRTLIIKSFNRPLLHTPLDMKSIA